MLAALEEAPLQDERLIYEPKYDGIRAIVEIDPQAPSPIVRIWSRLGNDKTGQFPELVGALRRYARRLPEPVVLDGEIVALDERGEPAGFQRLQGRIHLTGTPEPATTGAVALVAFDILRVGDEDLTSRPLVERRIRLEQIFGRARSSALRLSEVTVGDARALYRRALARGWEGLIAKRADSPYQAGKRSSDWRKLKIVRQQEFVIGGWTEPRASRLHFGALLLGYYAGGNLEYAGHTGSGFTQRELDRVWTLLKPLETAQCPFRIRPRTNERPHWVRPELVAQVKFSEWTDEGRLRAPIYLGLRSDVQPTSVRREQQAPLHGSSAGRVDYMDGTMTKKRAVKPRARAAALEALIAQLDAIERGRGSGRIELPEGQTLNVTNLGKVFWPRGRITKGELLRYYVRISPYILPVIVDRPLIMKRFPNGVASQAFYQQRAPADVPAGVRTAAIAGDKDVPSRLIGGTLLTLLYMTQLATISQDPWFSRVQSPEAADHAALDLDPMPGVSFARVLDVARWIRDELELLKVRGFPKTSGADGLHIYIPLQPGTPYEAGMLFCQIIATMVAKKHPKVATVARMVNKRGRTIYVDYLQNIRGKSLACAYSARASDYAGVSTPLTWQEIDEGIDRRDFTIRTVPVRVKSVGDLWAPLLKAKGTDLRVVQKYRL